VSRFDAGNLYLEAKSPVEMVWFEEHIRPLLKNNLFNENHRPVRVHVSTPSTQKQTPTTTTSVPVSFSPSPLDPHLTLSEFVTSPQNEVASKLIHDWVKSGKCPFNPLFLFGPKFSGKTHLLTAIAQNLKSRVFYITADMFTEHVVQAIRQGHMHEFRAVYRDIDVLLVDDVHRLGGRAATQEEFFHTFNTLHTLGKQIVLSSPVAPSKLEEIEPRLVSRFEWGVVLSIENIESEILLRKKAATWNVVLTPELCTFLAKEFPSNPVLALQALVLRAPKHEALSVVAAQTLLKDLLAKQAENALTPEKVVKNLSSHFGITPEDVTGKSQMREFALPRQIAMYLCRKKLEMPFQAIGKFFGRDHSTVMASVKQIEKAIEEKQTKVLEAMEHSSK